MPSPGSTWRSQAPSPRPLAHRIALALVLYAAWFGMHWWNAPPPEPASGSFYLFGVPVALSAWICGAGVGALTAFSIVATEFALWQTPLRSAVWMGVAGVVIAWLLAAGHRIAAREEVGLGWFSSPLDGENARIWWHNGMTGGFATFAGFVKESGSAVVVLSNADHSTDLVATRMLRTVHAAATEAAGKTGGA